VEGRRIRVFSESLPSAYTFAPGFLSEHKPERVEARWLSSRLRLPEDRLEAIMLSLGFR